MEESNDQSRNSIPRDTIRSIQSDIKAYLDNYDVDISDTSFLDTSNVCACVRDGILNYEDEPHLTKCQNNCRRIFIASELLISICSVYDNIVDYEFSRTIYDMVQWERCKNLSGKIRQKIRLDCKAEKCFATEARRNLKEAEIRNSEAETIGRDAPQPAGSSETETEFITRHEGETSPVGQQTVETTENAAKELNGHLDDAPSFLGNLTAMREEAATEFSEQQLHLSPVSRPDLPVPDTVIETSIQEPEVQEMDESLREILETLEDRAPEGDMAPIEQPETLLESSEEPTADQAVGERPSGSQADSLEESEEWNLPRLESVETTRKRRRRVLIDEDTIIHQYAKRAMRLNRNIKTQRVNVFEGPPNILQAFSPVHLLKTPAFRTSAFRDVRNSTLSTLYNRHLRTEVREVESVLSKRRAVDEHRVDISKTHLEITQDVGVRVGMYSAADKSDVLADVPSKRSRLEDLEISSAAAIPIESLIGMPISRILSPTIPPLEKTRLERINKASIAARNLRYRQGQSIVRSTSSPFRFMSTRVKCPSEKFREFNYVYNKIHRYWSDFEDETMGKCISLKEFLSLESAENVADFLTVLRVVDKMSLQWKLKLEFKDGDVLIRPFESIYFSGGQFVLERPELN